MSLTRSIYYSDGGGCWCWCCGPSSGPEVDSGNTKVTASGSRSRTLLMLYRYLNKAILRKYISFDCLKSFFLFYAILILEFWQSLKFVWDPKIELKTKRKEIQGVTTATCLCCKHPQDEQKSRASDVQNVKTLDDAQWPVPEFCPS